MLGMILGSQVQRSAVVLGCLARVETTSSVAGACQVPPQPLPELRIVASRCACQLERLFAVVHEDLGLVLRAVARDFLDPGCGRAVLLCACRPRDLLIGDVAYEHMPEREFILPFDG